MMMINIALARKIVAPALLALGCLFTQMPSFAQTSPVPGLSLAQEPLFIGRGNVHPNLVLDLSVEYPTVGAAYRGGGNPDDSYSSTTEYIGYFNPKKCYTYPNASAKIPNSSINVSAPDLSDGNGYFRISGDADANHECPEGTAFSGNFLNWAASSSIDMLRYALTGGDRIKDTATETVLQRAYLRDDTDNPLDPGTFYANSGHFPRKRLTSASSSAPNKVTPFDVSTLYVVSCRDRILFSDTINSGNNCDTARYNSSGVLQTTDKKLGEYLARVKVCDSNEGPTRADLCSRYGSNYKPEGNLQRYSDKLRAAAFGYLTEYGTSNNNLYGGVLRAPAKYVGPKKFEAPRFAQATNDKAEWDVSTGVFYANPLNSSAGNSGVVNYLNKFGRTNPNALGKYKVTDPVGELYYESLRYLQGKQPTAGSTNATNPIRAMGSATTDDNFPVVKTWDDPITASCQSNYIVVIGDVNTHRDGYIPGSQALGSSSDSSRAAETATSTYPALNVATWSSKISEMETSSAKGNLAPRSNLTNLHSRTDAGSTYGTYNMAGLAYWANTNDIRLDKPVRVKTFTIDVDEGGNGSIEDDNSRTRKPRNSQFYLAAKYGGFLDKGDSTSSIEARRPDGNPFYTLDVDGKTILNNNSEWTGAPNGTDPSNYFLASQPSKLISAIKDIFRVVSSNSGTISGVTLTSTRISTDDGSHVFQPGFDPSKWSGTLRKLKLTLEDTGVVSVSELSPPWDAGIKLTGKPGEPPNPVPADRKIYTSYTTETGGLETTPFVYASLTQTQQGFLNRSPAYPYAVDNLGQKRVEYLRGVRSDEIGQPNGVFRTRDRVLGDIVNSNPTLVGAPATYMQGEGYANFYNTYKDRAKTVYVGANDGMLHAFNAETGVELFAYVPGALVPELNKLTDPAYVHRPYVDGGINVTEAKVGSEWKTILVSGMGGGAQGIFVLDVTNPSNFNSGDKALWEFTDKNDPDMGNVFGQPVVAKFRTGTATGGVPTYKHFVVVANGYNSSVNDSGDTANTCDAGDAVCNKNGEGALFLLSLDKPKSAPWQKGVNYYKFTTPVSDSTKPNGLSAPALVVGNGGEVRYAYAGDLQGNLWRFDFTTLDSSSTTMPWASVRSSSYPVFTARDDTSNQNRQPITQEPKVVYAPGGGFVVMFGTGKFLEGGDTTNFTKQSFYAIYDTTYNADRVTGRSQLQPRTLQAYTTTGGVNAMTITGDTFYYGTSSGTKKGWYLDFYNSVNTGERSVTNALVSYGTLFFNTLLTGSNPCEKGGGRTYGLCALQGLPLRSNGTCASGEVTGHISTVGMLSSPVLIETGTTIGDRDSIGRRQVNKRHSVINFGTGGSDGTAAPVKGPDGPLVISLSPPASRISWREILNWEDERKKRENN